MQAFEAESGRKGDDTKGQFGYGAVIEDGKKEDQQPQESGLKRNKTKLILGIVVLALLATGVALMMVFKNNHEETLEEQFARYRTKFKRNYSDEQTLRERFAAFKENVREIREQNAADGGATFGWNQFTDMTKDEFLAKLTGKENTAQDQDNVQIKSATGLRSSPTVSALNWHDKGVVPPVRDQGMCGSCWAYATVASIETAYIMANSLSGDDVTNFELSVQQMVSCDKNGWNAGCNGGDPPGAFDWVTNNGGLATESNYPYTSSEGSTGKCTSGVEVLDGTNVKNWGYATTECESTWCNNQDEETMAASVEDYGPITVCVNANYWQSYTGGVMSSSQCGSSGYWALNHCVQLTGFDLTTDNETGKKYWILRNSWAEDWGEDGLMRVEYGTNTCGVADEAIYVELE